MINFKFSKLKDVKLKFWNSRIDRPMLSKTHIRLTSFFSNRDTKSKAGQDPRNEKKTSKFLLPDHFVKKIIRPGEEVSDLAALLVSLSRVEDFEFRSFGEIVADGRNLEHNPL